MHLNLIYPGNQLSYYTASPVKQAPAPQLCYYTKKEGDYLYKINVKLDISFEHQLEHCKFHNLICPGNNLRYNK